MEQETVRVSLELFEGPLDLLLHLIQTQHIDIAAVSISQITDQYLKAIELMQEMDLDIAGEYLVMAATLILIKSKSLLPSIHDEFELSSSETDPKEILIERLKRYQLFREAGKHLEHLNQQQSNFLHRGRIQGESDENTEWVLEVTLVDLLKALRNIVKRNFDGQPHIVVPQTVTIRDKMAHILKTLNRIHSILLSQLFLDCTSKQEAIVIFLAILELIRIHSIQARQRELFGDIRLVLRVNETAGEHAG